MKLSGIRSTDRISKLARRKCGLTPSIMKSLNKEKELVHNFAEPAYVHTGNNTAAATLSIPVLRP